MYLKLPPSFSMFYTMEFPFKLNSFSVKALRCAIDNLPDEFEKGNKINLLYKDETYHPEIWRGLLISPWLGTEPGGDPKC